MESIKSYLDNVFAAFPQTEEIQILKRDIQADMEEKYVTLRQSGKNEDEAAYSVINNFGSIEEISAELGLEIKHEAPDKSIFLSLNEALAYLKDAKKCGLFIAFGVFLIISGVSSVISFNHAFVLFVAIAISVTIFIVCGNKMSAYEDFEKTQIRLDNDTRTMVENERAVFMPKVTAMIAAGVALIILSAGAFTVIDFPVPLFLNIVALSVFLFIISGTYSSAYDVLLNKGDYSDKAANKHIGQIIGAVSVIYWPAAAIIFLVWSFLYDAWGISWVVWPVAGILFGAISAGISVYVKAKKK